MLGTPETPKETEHEEGATSILQASQVRQGGHWPGELLARKSAGETAGGLQKESAHYQGVSQTAQVPGNEDNCSPRWSAVGSLRNLGLSFQTAARPNAGKPSGQSHRVRLGSLSPPPCPVTLSQVL